MKRLLAVLALALLVSLMVGVVPVAAQNGGNDSASGRVTFFAGQEDTFSAKSSSLGTDAQGQWKFTNSNTDPDQTLTGEVKCLRVSGGLFEARGEITDAKNVSGPFAPQGFILHGSDSGKFSTQADTYSRVTTLTPQDENSCVAPVAGFPVTDGEVIVKDAP